MKIAAMSGSLRAGSSNTAVLRAAARLAPDGVEVIQFEGIAGLPFSGVLKNALDWLVGSHQFPDKPVALINTSPRATHALAALTLTLETMSARLATDACLTLPLLGGAWDEHSIAADPALAEPLRVAMERFAAFINTARA
ncbi:chromate reductase [Bradyrhizobium sp. USDA 4449]